MTLTQINKAGLDELALDHVFTIGASGTDHYTFQGEGLNGTVNDPTLYLTRGKTYRFENGSGGHPIRIQSTSGASGTAYNTGVTNNAGSGTVIVEVQHDAPDVLYYQCTSHANMNGILYITGALADGGVTTAKLADDAVTDAKLANSINSAIAANTAKSTNATHTGDVTGSGSLTIANNAVTTAKIADEAVTLAKLPHGDGSNDGKFLRANNGADPTFETVTSTTINNNAGGKVITGSGTANTLNAQSNVNVDGSGRFLIGTTTEGNAGADDLTIATSGDTGMTIRSGTSNAGGIYFSDGTSGDDEYRGVLNYNHASNFMRLYTNSTERMRIDSSGNVGIGETSPADNRVRITSPHQYNIVAKSSNGNGSYHNFTGVSSGGSITSYITHNGRVGAADGIIFGSDTAAANILDDYEEGTWSPGIDRNASSMTGVSYSHRTGTYTKVGRLVTVWFDFQVSSGGTSGGGNYYITELPFTALYGSGGSSNNGGYGAPTFRDATLVHGDFRIYGSSSYISNRQIYLQHYNSSGNATATSCNGSGRLTGQATYFAA